MELNIQNLIDDAHYMANILRSGEETWSKPSVEEEGDGEEIIRIISARAATPSETKRYYDRKNDERAKIA